MTVFAPYRPRDRGGAPAGVTVRFAFPDLTFLGGVGVLFELALAAADHRPSR